ncbi:preprotein translocase subunit SecA, partial [Candidatus Microgenomates bacterium]|nr:preprotein translocase subunit SecA [Candidatus Microgenomates bacterium]
MLGFLGKFLNSNEKEVGRLMTLVATVSDQEQATKKLKDKEFPKKTAELKLKLERGQTLDDLLPEAFALVREASFRVNKERHFDVQVLAAIALHQGKIAEQKTGEGKTLTASMPLYLNALTGRGVHLVTVNDYLVKVGVGWMGPIYHFLGLTCAGMIHDTSFIYDPEFVDDTAPDWRLRHLRPVSRKEAYGADITYGINSEYGFDYLRDNMAQKMEDLVQREFHYAIVDEVDSVLIDEARTPHIISAPDSEPTKKYYEYAQVVEKLTPTLDYVIDEKLRTSHLTDHGISKVENLLGIKDVYEKDFATVHHIEAALKARTLYHREKEYIVRDNQVIIVDEFTGRLMPGRRWSEGIHQAVEAKENVPIQ